MARRPQARSGDPLDALAENTANRYAAMAGYKNVLDRRGNALLSVEERAGARSKPYGMVLTRLKHDEAEFERIKTSVRRPLARMSVRPAILIVFGAGLAAMEALANKFLFDIALQSVGIASYAASIAVTAFLLVMAHFAGRGLRQVWSDHRSRIIVSSLLTFICCFAVASIFVMVLTVARAAFASETGSIDDLLRGVQGSVSSLGPIGAVIAAFSNTSAMVLACINIGGVVTTMLVAFFSHDPDRDYDHVADNVESGEKKLAKIHAAYLDARERTIKEFAPDLIGYAENYNTANRQVVELKTRLDRPIEEEDRFVLTDLDRMSEDAEQEDERENDQELPEPQPGAPAVRQEPIVRSMREFRRPTGTGNT
ncbi:MAG: hypothetical protein P4M09_30780 [Devosia sp.]|nr:hypothetical protein [Devosia sp.]